MSNRCYILIFTHLLLFCSGMKAQQYQLDNYRAEEGGLAQSQIYCMLEDARGYIWMGTQGGGINRFDGKSFDTYRSKTGLPNNYVDALYEDTQGHIWVGTHNGLSRYNGLEFKNYLPSFTSDFRVSALLQKDINHFWVGTHKGLYLMENEEFEIVKGIPRALVHHLFRAADQSVWVSTSVGLFQIVNGKVVKIANEREVYHKDFRSVNQDDAGNIWAATYTGGIYLLNGDSTRRLTAVDGIGGQHVQTIYKDRSGKMWIGTQDRGISIWDPSDESFTYLSQDMGLLRNDIKSIIEDTWGNIWIGTPGGVSKYYGRQFEHISINRGDNDDYVYAIAEDTLGHLWVSASSKGLAHVKDGEIVKYNRDFGFMNVRCKAIFVDDANQVWIGTEGRGLALYDGKGFTFFNNMEGLENSFVKDIMQDRAGHIWVATAGSGIIKIKTRDSTYLDSSAGTDDLPIADNDTIQSRITKRSYSFERFEVSEVSRYVNAILEDQKGRLWFATRNKGIGVIENDSLVYSFDRSNGLPDNHIRSIVEDEEGYIWLGTANAGICRIELNSDTLSIKKNTERDGLNSNNVYLLAFDDRDRLWAGCGKGIDLVELDAARNFIKAKHFGKAEGFVGVETCANAVLKDRSDRIWFGTINGLTLHIPGAAGKNPIPPKVSITEVRIGYDPIQFSAYPDWADDWGGFKEGLVVKHSEAQWTFEFKGLHQNKPNQVQYKWKLEGWDEDWLGPFQQNIATYSQLKPGRYTFHVIAGNTEAGFSQPASSNSFYIEPPFWQTWWFKLAVLSLGLLLIGTFIRMRINRVRQQAAIKTERLEMEKNMIQLEQKALQLQMNPHFIFNVLNSIQSLITKKDEKTARYFLAKFSKLMRGILENSRETKITLEQEIQTLDDYLKIEQFSRGNAFDFEIKVDPKLEIEEVMIPPMLLQPFVENAIIHGVGQVAEGGLIEVDFLQKYGTLECTITDNGPGIEQARARKSQQEHGHKSAALEVTQERLDLLNTGIQNKSLEIIDLTKEGNGVQGTRVVLRLVMGSG